MARPDPPRIAHLRIARAGEVRRLVEALAAAHPARMRMLGFLDGDEPDSLDPDEALFGDYDHLRGHGEGFFREDEAECASRRVDLRTPLDEDPGPIALPEADEVDEAGVTLRFRVH